MPFVKGGKPGPGKPKGSKNKKTIEWELLGDYVCNQGVKRYMAILKNLPDVEFSTRFEHVLEYFKPRLGKSVVRSGFELSEISPLSEERKAQINKALADL